MFGTNQVRKPTMVEDGRLEVQSIFSTIQGEGPFAGRPAVFIRLAGCNLRCWFCDTDFETGIGNFYTVERIVAEVHGMRGPSPLVVLTGGEPLRQNLAPLLYALFEEDLTVQIETAGTLWQDRLAEFVFGGDLSIVCSPKTPSVHPGIEANCFDYKYIVDAFSPSDPADGLPMMSTQTRPEKQPPGNLRIAAKLFRPTLRAEIWVQPMDRQNTVQNKANMDLAALLAIKHGYRVSLQTHKVLGVE